jgi:hypothetical protein
VIVVAVRWYLRYGLSYRGRRGAAGHAFVQNLRGSHYELALDAPVATRLAAAFTELAQAI